MLPAMAGGTGLMPESGHSGAGVGGGSGSTGVGPSFNREPCVSGGRSTGVERLYKRPGAGGLECLHCTCTVSMATMLWRFQRIFCLRWLGPDRCSWSLPCCRHSAFTPSRVR